MKKLYAYIALIPIIACALIPPISVGIEAPSPMITTWLILIAAFFGFYTLFLEVNLAIKIISVGAFVNCFFSTMPYFSFLVYPSLIACVYFFILCTKIEDWTPIFKALQVVVFINIVLLIMQFTGHDSLLNFGLPTANCLGTIGSNNQLGGLASITSALLVSFNPLYFLIPLASGVVGHSMGTFLAGTVGALIYGATKYGKGVLIIAIILLTFFTIMGIKQHDFIDGSGRTPVWKKTMELANQKPLTGWGMGTYKFVMNAFLPTFRFAHNSALQILFEFGYLGLILITILLGTLIYQLIRAKEILCLSGLGMIITDSMVHFPERQIQVVLILVAFLAYCGSRVNTKGREISYG